jgi:hypothetical protein
LKQSGRERSVPKGIARQTGINLNIVEIELEALTELELVGYSVNMNDGITYYIPTKGLKALWDMGQLP